MSILSRNTSIESTDTAQTPSRSRQSHPRNYHRKCRCCLLRWLPCAKSEILEAAEEMFKSTGINLRDSGKRYLGAMLGKRPAVFVREKVVEWVKKFENLAVTEFHLPTISSFSVSHALSCSRGAFPTIRHNYLHSTSMEVCHNVAVDLSLQLISGVNNGARPDVKVQNF